MFQELSVTMQKYKKEFKEKLPSNDNEILL